MKGYFWVEPNGFSTRAQWSFWIDEALAYNPHAKAAPPKKKRDAAKARPATAKTVAATGMRAKSATSATTKAAKPPAKKPAAKKHSIFEADD